MIHVYGDGEKIAVDWLDQEMPDRWPGVTVGTALPEDWKPTKPEPRLVVAWDGTPRAVHPMEEYQTIRVTSYCLDPSDAKALCSLGHAVLLAYPYGRVEYLTGPVPGEDPTTGSQIASATVRMTVASAPIA